MDNIETLYCSSYEIDQSECGEIQTCDFTEDIVCFITQNNYLSYYKIKNKADGISGQIYEVNSPLKYVKYMPIYDFVFLASEYMLLSVNPYNREIYNCIEMDKRIVELSWNEMESAFVVINAENEISLYTISRNSFNIKNTSFLDANVPVPALVGWGSKNTQFRGPKHLQYIDVKEKDEVRHVFDGPPKVSWRRNGEEFAVNYFKDGNRFIKVFDCNLNPLNQSEEYHNLGCHISFDGGGDSIACYATQNNVNKLVIFENNCRLKTVFDIPESKGEIKKLLYHPQLNILAVHSLDVDGSYISIYMFSNGECSLKQHLFYPTNRNVHGFDWLKFSENMFTTFRMVVFESHYLKYIKFRFIINRCPHTSSVAVVNGRRIEFYTLEQMIASPPGYQMSFDHTSPINQILFYPTRQLCALLDSNFQIVILEASGDAIDLVAKAAPPDSVNSADFIIFSWTSEDPIEFAIRYKFANICLEFVYILQNKEILLKSKCEKSSQDQVLLYNDTNYLVEPKVLIEDHTNLFYITKQLLIINSTQLNLEFGLSSTSEFYVNDKLICNDVTSFVIVENYLLFTHANCKLYCMRLFKDYEALYSSLDLSNIYSREIEQGARIVYYNNVLIPQVIFQLPRGSLESVKCTMIIIDVVDRMLADNKWNSAMEILRNEKVNWNVVIDLNPVRFDEHIEDFVKACRNVTKLSAIVNEFNLIDNCFETFYKNYLPSNASSVKFNKTCIVQDILKYLSSTDCINNLSNIAAIQQKHISLKSALTSILDVFEADPGNRAVCTNALKQLLMQTHFQTVLNIVYCFFNLEFLTLIYDSSSVDPKEYKPQLEQLRNMSPCKQRFNMCMKGHNIRNALTYLLRCADFDDEYVIKFISSNGLENVAYWEFVDPKSPKFLIHMYSERLLTVTRLFARKLSLINKHLEAGVILKRASLFEEAMDEYRKALEWREVIGLMNIVSCDINKRKSILDHLVEELLKHRRLDDVIAILIEHDNYNYKKAIKCLVEYKSFRKAIVLAQTYSTKEEIVNILPSLKEHAQLLLEEIGNLRTKFETYETRLQEVRNENKLRLENAVLGFNDDDELFSESGSTISTVRSSQATSRTRRSTASSKQRRKEEKKIIELRRGGQYEDIALMRALHLLYSEVFALGEEVREICLIAEFPHFELYESLHNNLSLLQEDMKNKIIYIWPETFISDIEPNDNAGIAIRQNKDSLAPEYRNPPSKDVLDQSWKLQMGPFFI